MNPGKRFEGKFRESLDLLPGYGMRIIDGGDRLKERMPADFWYFPHHGRGLPHRVQGGEGKVARDQPTHAA